MIDIDELRDTAIKMTAELEECTKTPVVVEEDISQEWGREWVTFDVEYDGKYRALWGCAITDPVMHGPMERYNEYPAQAKTGELSLWSS